MIAHKSVSTLNVTSIPSGVTINAKVPNAKFSNGKSNIDIKGNASKAISLKSGYTYVYTIKYTKNINSINRVKGNIVH